MSKRLLLPLLILFCLGAAAAAAPSSYRAPDKDWQAILDRLPNSIPQPKAAGMLAGEAEFAELKSRIQREPMRNFWNRLNSRFGTRLIREDMARESMHETDRAQLTRAAAFLWRATGENVYREKALRGLGAMWTGTWERPQKTWLEKGDAAGDYLQAALYLAADGSLAGREKREAVASLRRVGAEMFAQSRTLEPANNWRFHVAWATAMLGLGLPQLGEDPREMAVWLRRGMEEMANLTSADEATMSIPANRIGLNPIGRLFGAPLPAIRGEMQIASDGVFGEGPTYSRLQWLQVVELAYGLKRSLDLSLFDVGRIRKWGEWNVLAMLPNGELPPVGDAYGYAQVDTQVAANTMISPDAGLYRWHWDYGHGISHTVPAYEMTLMHYDDRLAPEPPSEKSGFWSTGQFAALRSGWAKDDTAVFLQGSSPLWVGRSPSGHRHPDALSFLVWAEGEPLVVEGGRPVDYSDPEYDAYYNTPKAHNVLLIDGEGPYSGRVQTDRSTKAVTPTEMPDHAELDTVSYVEMTATYGGADLTRRVWQIGKDWVVIADRAVHASERAAIDTNRGAKAGESFTAAWQIHSPAISIELEDGVFGWIRNGASLKGALLEPAKWSRAGAQWSDDTKPANGTALRAEREGQDIEFTALLSVGDSASNRVEFKTHTEPAEGRWMEATRGEKTISLGRGKASGVPAVSGVVKMDADLWIAWRGNAKQGGYAALGIADPKAEGSPFAGIGASGSALIEINGEQTRMRGRP